MIATELEWHVQTISKLKKVAVIKPHQFQIAIVQLYLFGET